MHFSRMTIVPAFDISLSSGGCNSDFTSLERSWRRLVICVFCIYSGYIFTFR